MRLPLVTSLLHLQLFHILISIVLYLSMDECMLPACESNIPIELSSHDMLNRSIILTHIFLAFRIWLALL